MRKGLTQSLCDCPALCYAVNGLVDGLSASPKGAWAGRSALGVAVLRGGSSLKSWGLMKNSLGIGANTLGKVNVVFVASLLTPVRVSCYEKDEPGAGGIVQ